MKKSNLSRVKLSRPGRRQLGALEMYIIYMHIPYSKSNYWIRTTACKVWRSADWRVCHAVAYMYCLPWTTMETLWWNFMWVCQSPCATTEQWPICWWLSCPTCVFGCLCKDTLQLCHVPSSNGPFYPAFLGRGSCQFFNNKLARKARSSKNNNIEIFSRRHFSLTGMRRSAQTK